MFRAPLCPSSGAQEYYTVVTACGILCCDFQVVGLVWSWGLCVRFAGCCSILQTGHMVAACGISCCGFQVAGLVWSTTVEQPLYNTLELLMMGIVVPETCWASNKICNKKTSVVSSWNNRSWRFMSCVGRAFVERVSRLKKVAVLSSSIVEQSKPLEATRNACPWR